MHLDRLVLDQFRSYRHLELNIPEAGLRISGRNATGKTSVLEALVMLSTTKSPRASADRDVVNWESGVDYGVRPYARIEARLVTERGARNVGIGVELDPERQGVSRKQFLVNGESVRAHDLVGVLKCVLFSPEDVILVSEPPAERRRQIDILISQFDRTYLYALSQYGKVLLQRNQLLRRFARDRRSSRDRSAVTELSFWDDELVAHGATVMAYRHRIARSIGEIVRARSVVLVDGSEVEFAYRPRLEVTEDALGGEVATDRGVIAAAFQGAIAERRTEEFRRGISLVGPHRDDFAFSIEGRELALYGSRGQQRLGVVAYRLAEMDIIYQQSGERPVLLLDDVLSELDEVHRDMLVSAVADCGCQILVTSTDAEMLRHPALDSLPMAEIVGGEVVSHEAATG